MHLRGGGDVRRAAPSVSPHARAAPTARVPRRAADKNIGDKGAKKLAAALKTNATLTKLDLQCAFSGADNGIKDQAALAAIESILDANKARPPASVCRAFASRRDPTPRSAALLGASALYAPSPRECLYPPSACHAPRP